MSRRARILRNVGIGLAAFAAIAVVAGILVVRTDRFREYVREKICLLYTSPSPRDRTRSRMPSSA